MRTFLSAILTLVAIGAIIVALPSMWVTQRVTDTEGFVSVIAPLAHDAQVQDFIADEITEEVAARTEFPGASAVVRPLAVSYVQGDSFPADFSDLVGQQHAWLFDEAPAGSSAQTMELDITPMINRALANQNLPFVLTVSGPVLVPMSEHGNLEAGRYHKVSGQIETIAYSASVIAAATAILALLFAHRRGTVLAWIGIGGLLAAGLCWVVALNATTIIDRQVSTEGSGHTVTNLAIDAMADDLTRWAMIAAAIGAAVTVVGIVTRLIGGRTRY
ncbi:hypothetical protein [Gordonia sp. NB41Y]|uniref:hypothetical protein n=1 Tax=Gordonia sp. NB41Y TaxID=875808 RepID=UPI0002BD4ADF|nr:hypothetical protein [Gordonia sp. NB41Y]EMP10454.1 membrane protein [Gordonia sp. NB41Y]WLP92289.1 hypothetical protein Q9K23_08720 [Gordonia sp. NB41Y]